MRARTKRHSRIGGSPLTLLIGAGGIVVLAVVAVILYWPQAPPTSALGSDSSHPPTPYAQVDGYDLILSYTSGTGSPVGYFDSPECSDCPLNLTPGGTWRFVLAFENADSLSSHEVTSIEVSPPFTLEGSTPALPASVPPSGSLSIDLMVLLPSSPGYYFLAGSIDAQ